MKRNIRHTGNKGTPYEGMGPWHAVADRVVPEEELAMIQSVIELSVNIFDQ